jgi:hypothetical protein
LYEKLMLIFICLIPLLAQAEKVRTLPIDRTHSTMSQTIMSHQFRTMGQSEVEDIVKNYKSGDVASPVSAELFNAQKSARLQEMNDDVELFKKLSKGSDDPNLNAMLARKTNDIEMLKKLEPMNFTKFNKVLATKGLSEQELHKKLAEAFQEELSQGRRYIGMNQSFASTLKAASKKVLMEKVVTYTTVASAALGLTGVYHVNFAKKSSARLDNDRSIVDEKGSYSKVIKQNVSGAVPK